MSRKALGSVAVVLAAAACSSAPGAPPSDARSAGQPPPNGAIPGNPRFFQIAPEDAFWVTHDATRDRVISGGARLELTLAGEVLASAWETDKAHNGDLLVGGLAVPQPLGGGYVFWTQQRVFRATEFTGPLVPIGLGVPDAADTVVRGARMGLRGVMIATDAGPRELLPGATVATAYPEPGVTDLAALDASRAIRLDVLGRPGWTVDGGKTWNDASQAIGTGVRTLLAGSEELWFETWQGRATLGKEGPLSEADGANYRYVDYSRPFQMAIRGTRAERDDSFWYGYREMQPLQSAIASGVRLADGSGFGVVRGAVVRADLATGKVLSIATDWLPNNIECQPLQVEDGVLFACGWDDYRGGAYVLRGNGVDPPRVERLFTDNGTFVADDDGGFAYTGSCKAEETYVDPEQYYGRYGRGGRYYDGEEAPTTTEPTVCVRRGAEDWVERKLTLDEDTSLVAWIPKKDGTAVALVRGTGRGAALPDVGRDSQRETSQNGVRVVRVFRDVPGWQWPTQQQGRNYYGRGGGVQTTIDRKYRALDDGTIVGWLSATEGSDPYYTPQKLAGGALRPGGRTEMFELPVTPVTMATGGPWGVIASRDGSLFETMDRGRTWRAAGVSALSPGSMQGTCSISGCAFSSGARIGWGAPAVSAKISDEKRSDPPAPKGNMPTIACEPAGMPRPEQSTTSPAVAALGSQAKITLTTSFGATLEMIRETPDAISSASSYYYGRHGYPVPPPAPTASASAAPSSKPKAKAAPLRTHTLVFRPPLDPLAPLVRHNATNASIGYRGRTTAIPLLGAGSEVAFLYFGDQNEAIVDRNELVTMPAFDSRRYYYYGDASGSLPGVRTATSRALLFGDFRRRAALEEHGTSPQKPPIYFAFERDPNRRRVLAMGRRDDSSVAILVLDAAAPETAGVAVLDRVATALGPLTRLAPWSSLTTADDPGCRADKKGYRALLSIDPSTWLALDPAGLPGVTLAKQGLALVRWGEERVCLEAVDVAVLDPRRRPDAPAGENLVVRWGAPSASKAPSAEGTIGADAVGALRSMELTQPLTCSLKRASK